MPRPDTQIDALTTAYRTALDLGDVFTVYEILDIAERLPDLMSHLERVEDAVFEGGTELSADVDCQADIASIIQQMNQGDRLQRVIDHLLAYLFRYEKWIRWCCRAWLIVSPMLCCFSVYQIVLASSATTTWLMTAMVSAVSFGIVLSTSLWQRSTKSHH